MDTTKLISILISAFLSCAQIPAQAQADGKYTVGQHVMADATGLGNFRPGVVTEVLPYQRYRVQMDDEIGKQDPWVMLERNMKPSSQASAPANNTGTTTGAASKTTGSFSVGQRVMADVSGIGQFKAGVITEVLPYDRFRVQFDDEVGKYDPWVVLLRNMKAGGPAAAPQQHAANTPQNIPNTATTANHAAAPAHNPAPAATHTTAPQQTTTQPHDEHAGDSDSPQWHTPGKGAPPSGKYVCDKIGAGGYGAVGDGLEIRGNTYRGIGQEGGFHPYTLGAINRITWSAGLMSLPDSWTIKHSYYAGPDYMGRPLIKIYYRSKSGFNDCIDCYIGK